MFRKGVSGNPNGRPKGSKNKATEVDHYIESLFSRYTTDLIKNFATLSPKEQHAVIRDLIPYLKPKLQSATMEVNDISAINTSILSTDQVNDIVGKIIDNYTQDVEA